MASGVWGEVGTQASPHQVLLATNLHSFMQGMEMCINKSHFPLPTATPVLPMQPQPAISTANHNAVPAVYQDHRLHSMTVYPSHDIVESSRNLGAGTLVRVHCLISPCWVIHELQTVVGGPFGTRL